MRNRFQAILLICFIVAIGFSFLPCSAVVTETRYMRNDELLLTANTASYDSMSGYISGYKGFINFGLRVYGVNGTTETEVTGGSPVAVATFEEDHFEEMLSATWDCSGTGVFQKFRVKVYRQWPGASWALMQTFNTDIFDGSLSAGVWTVYYRGDCNFDPDVFRTTWIFRYGGDSPYDSRIEDFVWTESVSKTWHSVQWSFSLPIRQINHIYWDWNLTAMQWNSITWAFNVTGMEWHSIQWGILLGARHWGSVTWGLILNIIEWHSLYWAFTLGPESNISILFIGMVLLGSCIVLLLGWRLKKRRF